MGTGVIEVLMMTIRYSQLLSSMARMTGLGTPPARAAAEATLTVLSRMLKEPDRKRLQDQLPLELKDHLTLIDKPRDKSEATFVTEVSRLGRLSPEQARIRAQAVLTALAEQEPGLVADLDVPDQLRGIFQPPGSGGGVIGPTGGRAPLTPEELDEAMSALPQWTGDGTALSRTVSLPEENIRALRIQLEQLKHTFGRTPDISKVPDGLQLTVRTASVAAVTALDIDLARRIDQLVWDLGAGIGRPLA